MMKAPRNARNVISNRKDADPKEKKQQALSTFEKPIHRASESLLSSTDGYANQRGILNFSIIILALTNGKMAVDNIRKNGDLIDKFQWFHVFMKHQITWPFVYIILGSNVFIFLTLYLERFAADKRILKTTTMIVHAINLISILFIPALMVNLCDVNPFGSFVILITHAALFLKLMSFVMVNKWCRVKGGFADKISTVKDLPSLVIYPNNLTVKNIYFFVFAPTLCYELNFPRNTLIRKRFLLERFFEILLLTELMSAIIQLCFIPLLLNSSNPFTETNRLKLLEDVLKQAVPISFLALMLFYVFFHSYLNFIAELLMFADRKFYGDWWNSDSLQYYWQSWNVPVHRWCLRHIYIPMLTNGYSKLFSMVIVFFVSGVLHEYFVSIPLRYRTNTFVGMLSQVPLIAVTNSILKGTASNVLMWVFQIGQSFMYQLLYHDYCMIHNVIQD